MKKINKYPDYPLTINELEKKLSILENSIHENEQNKSYGVKRYPSLFLWSLLLAHLLGVFFNLWEIDFSVFVGVFLFEAMQSIYNNLLLRIEINTLDISRDIYFILRDIKYTLNKKE